MMNLKMLFAFALTATLSTACVGRFNGGGHLPSIVDPGVKATFGFTGHASDSNDDGQADTFKGQFQYVDRAADVNVHVKVVLAVFTENDPFYGVPTARIHGVLDTGETVNTIIQDHGQPGLSSGDKFFIDISRGLTSVYYNDGVLGGGNVIWLPE